MSQPTNFFLQDDMASRGNNTVDLTDGETLPPPPQGSELFARLNVATNNGKVIHDAWVPISSHTAKCDLCLEHNKSVCQRCLNCNRQLCRKCIHTANGDGIHSVREVSLDWSPAAPVKRGSRGTSSSSTPPLNITDRRTAPSRACSSENYALKPSPLRVQTRAWGMRAAHSFGGPSMNINPAPKTTTAKRGRSDDDDPFIVNSDKQYASPSSALKKLKISAVLSPPSFPELVNWNTSPSSGGPSFTPLPVPESAPAETTPTKGKRVTIKLNTGSPLSASIASPGLSNPVTSNKKKPSTPGASKSKTTSNKKSPTPGARKCNNNKVMKKPAIRSASKPSYKNTKSMESPYFTFTAKSRCLQKKMPSYQPTTVSASGSGTYEFPPTLISPMDDGMEGDKTANELKAEQEKKQALENNQILLNLQSKGEQAEAEDMLDAAWALMELSRRG